MMRNHRALRTSNVLLGGALALIGTCAIMGAPALAQQSVGEITVVAPHVVREKVGTSTSGIPIEVVSLTRHVGYGDLDLTKASDVEKFKQRVRDTAKAACDQIDRLYPTSAFPSDANNEVCIKDATQSGMAQVDLVMAMAAGTK